MANTLANFLVGVGFDFDQKGVKEATSSMDSFKRSALQAGAAVAGAFGARALSTDIANRTLELTRFSDLFGATAEEVFAMGRVLEREGGTLDGFMNQMAGLERLRAGLLTGDISWIPEGALAGLDTSAIMNASNALEAYQALARQFPNLTQQQRLNVAEAIGLDEPSILLLSKGIENLESEFNRIRNIRPIDDEMIEQAQKYNQEWQDLKDNVGGVADSISTYLMPALNGALSFSNELFDLWREGFTVGEIIGETSAGGRLSAEASMGSEYAWLDTPIGDIIKDAIGENDWLRALIPAPLQYSFSDAQAALTLPPPSPTIITPSDTAPISNPVMQATQQAAQSASGYAPYGVPQNSQPRPIVNNIYLNGRMIKQEIKEVMEEEGEQVRKDFRSPLVN